MELDNCIKLIQTYLEKNPLVILGSGASAAYNLPTMGALSKAILKQKDKFSGDEAAEAIFESLESGIDLETAVSNESYNIKAEDYYLIREIVWKEINSADRKFFATGLQQDFKGFALKDLIKKLVSTAIHKADIVTTNYDRLAEYACDLAGATVLTGFEGTYYKTMEDSKTVTSKRVRVRERNVSIWKVHGSLDWFLAPSGEQCALTSCSRIPANFKPYIVPPSRRKYEETHADPYRTIIFNADKSISEASCFLAIGYGFNDNHIQPKIIEEIKNGKPIIIITKKATDACHRLVNQSAVSKFMIIEEESGKTKVTVNNEICHYDEEFWTLSGFLSKWC